MIASIAFEAVEVDITTSKKESGLIPRAVVCQFGTFVD
jgi:hypothetical protein